MTTALAVRPWSHARPRLRPEELAQGPRLWVVRSPAAGTPLDVSVLDERERRCAAALRRPAERALYVAAHCALRQVLGEYLGLAAESVELTRLACVGCGGPHGRPAVAGPSGSGVHFSLSHTGGLALLGLATRPLGVDVERVPEPRLVADAARSLHPTERTELARTSPTSRPGAFARCWTRKEAYLKATGEGLSGEALRGVYLGACRRPTGLPGWRVVDVDVPAGWTAACVVRDQAAVSGPGVRPVRRPAPYANRGSRGRR